MEKSNESPGADEKFLVKEAMEMLCRQNGLGVTHTLTQRDMEFLCETLQATTGVAISLSTMKRLLKGEFSRVPQIATLNAIAKNLGFSHWQQFKATHSNPEKNNSTTTPVPANVPPVSWNRRIRRAALVILALVVTVFALSSIVHNENKRPQNIESASFSIQRASMDEVPNTVVFHYNVDEVDADSFFIQQSWDRNRRMKIRKGHYAVTDIYYEPGYHTARLIANDSIIRTIDVSIPTDRWVVYVKDQSPAAKPDYFKSCCEFKDGVLMVDDVKLKSSGIDITTEKEFVYTYFPTMIAVSSDNYSLRARIRMKEVRSTRCPYIMVEVFCQRYFMFFRGTPKGCSGESFLQFGENFLSGKNHDLSSLGYDVTEWMDVEVIVRNRDVRIVVGGKESFQTSYKNTGGLLTGVGFISNGLVEIDHVHLTGVDGTDVVNFD
jgi:hypothetical protein